MNDISIEQAQDWIEAKEAELTAGEQNGDYPDGYNSAERIAEVKERMAGLRDCGWFRGYPENLIATMERQLLRTDSLETLSFDHELPEGGSEDDYQEIFEKFTAGSFGLFSPQALTIHPDNGTNMICSFRIGHETYRTRIDGSSDWFDDRVFQLISKAMAAAHPFLRFYELPTIDQRARYALVDRKAAEEAEKRGLLGEEQETYESDFE